jgi:uncharacterized protein YqeY
MTLIEILKKDKIDALKNKDVLKKNLLSVVISNANSLAKESKIENPTDEQTISSINKIKKGCIETYGFSESEVSKREIEILDSYLPKQFSEEELLKIISDFIRGIGEVDKKQLIGLVMKFLKTNYSGKYDGKMANSIINNM